MTKVLAGALAPDSGEMWLDGERYAPRGPLDARRRGIFETLARVIPEYQASGAVAPIVQAGRD